MRQTKKGQQLSLGGLPAVIALLAVAVLVLTFSSDIVSDVKDDQTADTASFNVSNNGLTGMLNLSDQFGNIGTVIGAGLIIGILVAAFAFARSR